MFSYTLVLRVGFCKYYRNIIRGLSLAVEQLCVTSIPEPIEVNRTKFSRLGSIMLGD